MARHLVIVGRGRLGRSLHALLATCPWTITLVGREPVPDDADVVLLAVPDRAIEAAAARVPAGPVLLHCSGASPVDVLRPRAPVGSFHPLMTFPGPDIALPRLEDVPAAIAGDEEALVVARQLASWLGMTPLHVPGDRRLYHAAAVMAGNFATVLLADAARVLQEAGVAEDDAAAALVPLAIASLRHAPPDPVRALTGPAARGDHATIQQHQQALEAAELSDQAELYRQLSSRALDLKRAAPFRSPEE